jgi:hypothetical protein
LLPKGPEVFYWADLCWNIDCEFLLGVVAWAVAWGRRIEIWFRFKKLKNCLNLLRDKKYSSHIKEARSCYSMDEPIDSQMAYQIQRIRQERLEKIRRRLEEEGVSEAKSQVSETCRSPGMSEGYVPNYSPNPHNIKIQSEHDFGLSPLSSQYKSGHDFEPNLENAHARAKVYPQEKFYQRAKLLEQHKMMFEVMKTQDIKDLANCKKMNSKSENILIAKLEENLTAALIEIDEDNLKILNFEQLGRVLFMMGAFKVIKYDENYNSKNFSFVFE